MSADNNVFGGFVGGSGVTYWGNITGNIDNQIDLIERLSHAYYVALSPNSWEFSDTYNMYVQTSSVNNRLPAKSRKSIPLSFSTSYFLPYLIFDFAGSLI